MCGRCATDGDGDVGMIINVPACLCRSGLFLNRNYGIVSSISCENAYAAFLLLSASNVILSRNWLS